MLTKLINFTIGDGTSYRPGDTMAPKKAIKSNLTSTTYSKTIQKYVNFERKPVNERIFSVTYISGLLPDRLNDNINNIPLSM